MTASSDDVAATTGGTELLNPCGMSTQTYGSWCDSRSSSVSSRFSSLSHDLWRNSTQMRCGFARSAHSTRESLFERRIVKHGGERDNTPPPLAPPSKRGGGPEKPRPGGPTPASFPALGVAAAL